MKNLKFNMAMWKEGKYFVTRILENNVSSFGETEEQAQRNTKEALELYLEENNEPKTKIHGIRLSELSLNYA